MSALRVVICGSTGRMGESLFRALASSPDLELIGGIAETPSQPNVNGSMIDVVTAADCASMLERADVVIDFSAPAALGAVIGTCADALSGKALVTGTTGLTADVQSAVERIAKTTTVVSAANFSIGVNLMLDLVQKAAAVLNDSFDIEIVEAHHRRKVDAPSGTALALAHAAAAGRGVGLDAVRIDGRTGETGARPQGQIALHALRGGSVVGEHRVHFFGDVERIELAHVATDRILFANGAITAARWAVGRPAGLYSMRDVLGL
ncbi:MAG: 4-hydroxy-tetrahydrodipicolinate reductase [Longimicrobiales bacterium]